MIDGIALVHLPSGPVAGHWRAPNRVEVSGVALSIVMDPERRDGLLAVLPTEHDARGGTTTFYARVEAYVHGALDIQGVGAAQGRGEHQQRGHEHQGQKKRAQQHGAKVAPRRAGRQSP